MVTSKSASVAARSSVRLEPPPISETRLFVVGIVQNGDRRGRTIGFPTANVAISSESIAPPDGVFAGYV